MSDIKHSPEPWPEFWERNDIMAASMDPDSAPVVLFSPLDYDRARVCVNFLAGIPSDKLDGTMLKRLLAVERERDEAVAAMRDLLPYAEACIGPTHRTNPPYDSVLTAARAIIAKAQR